eukprot:Sdes_comp10108_c0_seq2m1716
MRSTTHSTYSSVTSETSGTGEKTRHSKEEALVLKEECVKLLTEIEKIRLENTRTGNPHLIVDEENLSRRPSILRRNSSGFLSLSSRRTSLEDSASNASKTRKPSQSSLHFMMTQEIPDESEISAKNEDDFFIYTG